MSTLRFAALATALLALAACGAPEAQTGDPAAHGVAAAPSASAGPLVETRRAEFGTLAVAIDAAGEIRARRVSGIGAEVSGRLIEIFVDVGDVVAAGDPLFQIDPRPYEVTLAEARAGLAVARAQRDLAIQERNRVEKLVARDALSVQRGEQQRSAAAMAIAQVEQMEAGVERAASDLARTRVLAPYAAAVVERRTHEGELAGPAPAVVLQESGALVAVLNIPEAATVPIPIGAPVRFTVEGIDAPLESRIDVVSRRVDPETRTYEVRAPVADPSGRVKAGSYVNARIEIPSGGTPTPVIDRSSLVLRDGASHVFRLEGDTVRRVAVRVGAMTPERVAVVSGVAAGDEIVRGAAAGRLTGGETVRRATGAAPAAARADATP